MVLRQILTMTRRGQALVDPVEYLKIRISLLTEERGKNPDAATQLMFDKAIFELNEVLALLERTRV